MNIYLPLSTSRKKKKNMTAPKVKRKLASTTMDLSRFVDCQKHFEHVQALPPLKSITLTYPTAADAGSARARFYLYRRLDRDNNEIIYPPGDPLHKRSSYDEIIISIRDNVIIMRNGWASPVVTETE